MNNNLTEFKEDIITLQSSNGYLIVGSDLIRLFDINTAVFLNDMINKYNYWSVNDRLSENDTFFASVDDVKFTTQLSKYKQKKSIEILKDFQLLQVVENKKGKARVFKLYTDNVIRLLKLINDIHIKIKNDEDISINEQLLSRYKLPIDKMEVDEVVKNLTTYKNNLVEYYSNKGQVVKNLTTQSISGKKFDHSKGGSGKKFNPNNSELNNNSELINNSEVEEKEKNQQLNKDDNSVRVNNPKKYFDEFGSEKYQSNNNIITKIDVPEEVKIFYKKIKNKSIVEEVAFKNYIYPFADGVCTYKEKANKYYDKPTLIDDENDNWEGSW